jgi:light-regulated signal transduction histidine kinase (bacteriophytochrome)
MAPSASHRSAGDGEGFVSAEQISCDLQPIHAPGGIQPCGTLIATDSANDTIVFGSRNVAVRLGRPIEDLLGRPLGELLGEEQSGRLKQRDLRPVSPETLRPFECRIVVPGRPPSTFDALVHAHHGHTVLELFDHTDFSLPLADAERFRRRLLAELRKPDTLEEICTVLARTFRLFTAFDRVMVYRFHED